MAPPVLPSTFLPNISPTSFAGTTNEDVENWLIQLEEYFEATGLESLAPRVTVAKILLKGKARRWVSQQNLSDLPGDQQWNNFKTALKGRFKKLIPRSIILSRPFDRPKIRERLGPFLRIRDLVQCIRVCQAWRHSFEPFLYYEIFSARAFSSAKKWPPLRLVLSPDHRPTNYASYVHRLEFDLAIQAEYLEATFCNLRYIKFQNTGGYFGEYYSPPQTVAGTLRNDSMYPARITEFVRRHHASLQDVVLSTRFTGLSKAFWDLLADESLFPVLAKLSMNPDSLEHYDTYATIALGYPVDQDTSLAFWKACSRLKSLELHNFRSTVPNNYTWPAFSVLEDLILFESSEVNFTSIKVLGLLYQSPRLKTLNWAVFFDTGPWPSSGVLSESDKHRGGDMNAQVINGLARLATSDRLQKLDSLVLSLHPCFSSSVTLDAALAQLLDALATPLVQLEVDRVDITTSLSFPPLQRHFATLKFLHIGQHQSESSWMVQRIMTSCPLLEKFSGSFVRVLDMMEDEPWVCVRIRKLCLKFEFDTMISTPGKTEQDQQSHVGWQLSQLTRLKELSVCGLLGLSYYEGPPEERSKSCN
ncbi:hypothetical protein BGZ95_005274 [Linnemannia exigua]|uniref:Uncharacterized protein n=1 Tax=Linnemannia exigua TaxID=604196 RepID=A0AAD4D3S1_9FUNG|nr:hypothetical protein BGZ95_005274 [Linnemannia exigua]